MAVNSAKTEKVITNIFLRFTADPMTLVFAKDFDRLTTVRVG